MIRNWQQTNNSSYETIRGSGQYTSEYYSLMITKFTVKSYKVLWLITLCSTQFKSMGCELLRCLCQQTGDFLQPLYRKIVFSGLLNMADQNLCTFIIHKLKPLALFPNLRQSPSDSLLRRSLRIMSIRSWTTSDIAGLNSGSDCKTHLDVRWKRREQRKTKAASPIQFNLPLCPRSYMQKKTVLENHKIRLRTSPRTSLEIGFIISLKHFRIGLLIYLKTILPSFQ